MSANLCLCLVGTAGGRFRGPFSYAVSGNDRPLTDVTALLCLRWLGRVLPMPVRRLVFRATFPRVGQD